MAAVARSAVGRTPPRTKAALLKATSKSPLARAAQELLQDRRPPSPKGRLAEAALAASNAEKEREAVLEAEVPTAASKSPLARAAQKLQDRRSPSPKGRLAEAALAASKAEKEREAVLEAQAPAAPIRIGEDELPPVGAKIRFMFNMKELQGVASFGGETDFAPGSWIGVILDQPIGKNDGEVRGKRYFTCPPLHGLFIRRNMLLEVLDIPDASELGKSPSLVSTAASACAGDTAGPTSVSSAGTEEETLAAADLAAATLPPGGEQPQDRPEVLAAGEVAAAALPPSGEQLESCAEATPEPALPAGGELRAQLEAASAPALPVAGELRAQLEAASAPALPAGGELRAQLEALRAELEAEHGAREAELRGEAASMLRALETEESIAEDAAAEASTARGALIAMSSEAAQLLAEVSEAEAQAQEEHREQLQATAIELRRGQEECLASIDALCDWYELERSKAREACVLAERRAEALAADAEDEASATVEERAEAHRRDLARLEAFAAASLRDMEASLAKRAAEAVEARVKDMEAEAAASKEDLVFLLAEEASSSLQDAVAEAEECLEASHRTLVGEVEAQAAADREAAVKVEAQACEGELRRKEQLHAVVVSELLASRRELEAGKQEFEEVLACQAAQATEEYVTEVRDEEYFKKQELEAALLVKATEERAAALLGLSEKHEARISQLEAVASTSKSELEAEVRQHKQEYEEQTSELNVAARECLGQRLQIDELIKELARHEEERPIARAASARMECDKSRSTARSSFNGMSSLPICDLLCCARRPRHERQPPG